MNGPDAVRMPAVQLADGRVVAVPSGADGAPDWSAVHALYGSPIATAAADAVRELAVIDFRRRFTAAEKAAIYTAAAGSPLLRAWLDDLATAESVHLDHPDVVEALGWLTQAGILTPERAAAIRA